MRKLVLAVILVSMVPVTAAQGSSIGTAPGVLDLGTLERGETYQARFYVTSNFEDEFVIRPSYSAPLSSLMRTNNSETRYDFEPSEASQERIIDWVNLRQRRKIIDPQTTEIITLGDGSLVEAQGEVVFTIEVPQNAEPGYHAGTISMNPQVTGGTSGGASVSALGVTEPFFVFDVPGQAERNVDILDVSAIRSGEREARIDFLLENTGTVTVDVSTTEASVFNQFGDLADEITVSGGKLSPGETEVVSTFWNDENVSEGEYRVSGDINYITGQQFLDSTVDISGFIRVEGSNRTVVPGGSGSGDSGIPSFIIVAVLVLLGSAMYYFDFDPLWIVVFMVAAAAIAAVVQFGLPLWLIPVILLATGGVLYLAI